MMPIWSDTDFGNDQLYHVYAGINRARSQSPALRSPQRWFLDATTPTNQIFAVAKYEQSGLSPTRQDVVLAFASLDRNNEQWANYKIPTGLGQILNLSDTRVYNVKNIAAYTKQNSARNSTFIWRSEGYSGLQLKTEGVWIGLKPVPTNVATWTTAPFEAQYLKLYDVTPPPSVTGTPTISSSMTANGTTTVSWSAVTDPEGPTPTYRVTASNGSTFETSSTSVSFPGLTPGTYTFTVTALNPNDPSKTSTPSSPSPSVRSLSSTGDEDGDGQTNADELIAGTDPLNANSRFAIETIIATSNETTLTWTAVPGRTYTVQACEDLTSWVSIGTGTVDMVDNLLIGSYIDTVTSPSRRFYRLIVENIQ
jgi:hypothetical protein